MATIAALIALSIFKTVEFYVITSVVAAAIIAAIALPERKGEVKTYLLQGDLVTSDDNLSDNHSTEAGNGSIVCECHSGNIVSIRREGLHGVYDNGAVSLVIHVSGFDVTIDERITAGGGTLSSGCADAAIFRLEFFAPEWYHIRYESELYGEHAAFTLHVREGIVVTKPLIH